MIVRPHALKGAGIGAGNAKAATDYYETSTRWDREALADRPPAPAEGASEGVWVSFGPHPMVEDGTVGTPEDVRRALAGEDPWSGQTVQNAWDERRWMGTDWTCSSDKAVSLLMAVAGPEERAAIREAAWESFFSAFGTVVAPEAYGRLGHGGTEHVPVSISMHVYEQTQSRLHDPQVHGHGIVPNLGGRADGSVGAVEERGMYGAAKAASAVATLELQTRLGEMGYALALGEDGALHQDGVPRRLEDEFARRADEMRAEAERRFGPDWWDQASAAQRQWVAIQTRPRHDPGWREDWAEQAKGRGVQAEWETWAAKVHEVARAREAGLIAEPIDAAERDRWLDEVAREAAGRLTTEEIERGGDRRPATSLFTRSDMVAETAWLAAGAGLGARAGDVLRAVERAEARGDVVVLAQGETLGQARASTPEMIATEQRLMDRWGELLDGHGFQVEERHVQAAVAAWEARHPGEHLSGQQQAAVQAITSDHAAGVVSGLAGVGKGVALEVAADAYERAGYDTRGEAWTGLVAQQMTRAAGIPSGTMAGFEAHGRDLTPKTVTFVDEAAVVGSPHMEQLLRETAKAGGKLVVVQDVRQQQPIGWGSAAEHLERLALERAPEATSALQEIQRQTNAEVRAIAALAAGVGADHARPGDALTLADQQGRVSVYETHEDTLRAAAGYVAEQVTVGKDAMAIVATRADAVTVNAAVREALRERDLLPHEERVYQASERGPAVALAVGDRVAITRNDPELGVRNGQRGEVYGISEASGSVTIRLAGDQRVERDGTLRADAVPVHGPDGTMGIVYGREAAGYVTVEADQVAQRTPYGYTFLAHDYARTGTRAQGTTVDAAAIAGAADSHVFSRQWGDPAMTRAREDVRVFLSVEGTERREVRGEPPHWPRDQEAAARQEPGPNPLRDAREERDRAQEAAREARGEWHVARDDLKQARAELRTAREAGRPEDVAAAGERVREARVVERAVHEGYSTAKAEAREAREHAAEAWREAREERQAGREVSPENRQSAVEKAARGLDRDRPGITTLDYPKRSEKERERGQDQAADRAHEHGQERGHGRGGADHDDEQAQDGGMSR